MKHQVSKDLVLEKFHQANEQMEDLFKGMVIVGNNWSEYSADKDHLFLLEECGLTIFIPAEVITPVVSVYEIAAKGLFGGKFIFPAGTKLISAVCYISMSFSHQFNKPVEIQLEHCANITDKKQADYLSFAVAKSGPPFNFEYLPGGSFSPESQYGTIHLREFSFLAIVLGTAVGSAILGLGGATLGATVGSTILGLGGAALGAAVSSNITSFTTYGELPNCNYRAYIFCKELVRNKTWRMHFTVVQNTTYSKLGSEEFNFPFHFATKMLPSNVLGELDVRDIDTEKTLKLLGFPDKEVHGWKIMPLRKPPVINRKNVDDFSQSWCLDDPPNIPVEVFADPTMDDFRDNLEYPITIEGIEVADTPTSADCKPQIVITKSLASISENQAIPTPLSGAGATDDGIKDIDKELMNKDHSEARQKQANLDITDSGILVEHEKNVCIPVNIENKLDLIRLLSPIEYKWRQIGHALKISHGDLENILDQRNRNADRLADVIQVWLDKRPTEVTWRTIITAVDLPPVLEPSIAKSILNMCLSKTSE